MWREREGHTAHDEDGLRQGDQNSFRAFVPGVKSSMRGHPEPRTANLSFRVAIHY